MEKVVKKNPNLLTNAKDVIVETEMTDGGKKKGERLTDYLKNILVIYCSLM